MHSYVEMCIVLASFTLESVQVKKIPAKHKHKTTISSKFFFIFNHGSIVSVGMRIKHSCLFSRLIFFTVLDRLKREHILKELLRNIISL
jgi:hypothetical protein